MYAVVLAAVDGSSRSARVLEAALELADHFGGRVHLFRALQLPAEFPPAAHMPSDPSGPILAGEARSELELLAEGRPDVIIEPIDTLTPQPWRAIGETARRIGADLIVIGSHGYGGWDRLLRTNAAQVADRADRNVLIVHERTP
jgi:nucleotide-binding universal stress UspA family protein